MPDDYTYNDEWFGPMLKEWGNTVLARAMEQIPLMKEISLSDNRALYHSTRPPLSSTAFPYKYLLGFRPYDMTFCHTKNFMEDDWKNRKDAIEEDLSNRLGNYVYERISATVPCESSLEDFFSKDSLCMRNAAIPLKKRFRRLWIVGIENLRLMHELPRRQLFFDSKVVCDELCPQKDVYVLNPNALTFFVNYTSSHVSEEGVRVEGVCELLDKKTWRPWGCRIVS